MGKVKDELLDDEYSDYTREEWAEVREFRGFHELADTSVTPDMTHREMLQILQALLLAWDHERVHIPTWKLFKVRPGMLKYHPGRPPPHRRRREAREKAAADAAKQGAGQG